MVKLKCPCKSVHVKKRDDFIVKESHCDSMLGIVKPVNGTEVVFRCRNCKNLTIARVVGGIVYLEILDKRTKIKSDQGKVVLDVAQETCT